MKELIPGWAWVKARELRPYIKRLLPPEQTSVQMDNAEIAPIARAIAAAHQDGREAEHDRLFTIVREALDKWNRTPQIAMGPGALVSILKAMEKQETNR